MTALASAPAGSRTGRRAAVVVLGAVVVAVALNLAVHAAGRAAGGRFTFTAPAGPAVVDAATVAGFTAVPLLVGLTLAAVLARRWAWVVPVALVLAPALALVTVVVMTLPADLDAVSTVTLALCHVVLAPVAVLALRRLPRRR